MITDEIPTICPRGDSAGMVVSKRHRTRIPECETKRRLRNRPVRDSGLLRRRLLGPDGSLFVDGELGFATFTLAGVGPGFHTLDLQVLDDEDDVVDTAILIDALAIDGSIFESF